MDKTLELLNELKEQIAYQFVTEFSASDVEASKVCNAIVKAIESVIQRHSGE